MRSPESESPIPSIDGLGTDQVILRPIGYGDLPQIIAIERRAFATPWSAAMFVLELSKASNISLGAFLPERRKARRLAGYLIASRYADIWHLMNLAVDPPLRRQGLAGAMLEELIGQVPPHEPITLEVRPSNTPAIALYERFGFRSAGTRPGYYRDTGEDALIMWRGVDGSRGPERRS